MDISNWIPAFSTTFLFALVMWLFRSLISTRLTKSVENEFNTKLENLKSELRAKEAHVDALLNGAMSGLMSRQSKLYERQLAAIEHIWEAVTELGKVKHISATMATLKFEECAKEASRNPDFREVIKIMGCGFNKTNIKLDAASKARPFLSPLAWAYYSAYQAILMLDALKFEALKAGLESPEKYIKSEEVTKLVKAALPHQSDYLNKYGSTAHYYLLDEIENLLLSELQNMQKGIEVDKENVARAASITKAVDGLNKSVIEEESRVQQSIAAIKPFKTAIEEKKW